MAVGMAVVVVMIVMVVMIVVVAMVMAVAMGVVVMVANHMVSPLEWFDYFTTSSFARLSIWAMLSSLRAERTVTTVLQ